MVPSCLNMTVTLKGMNVSLKDPRRLETLVEMVVRAIVQLREREHREENT